MRASTRRTLKEAGWFFFWLAFTMGGTAVLIHWLHP